MLTNKEIINAVEKITILYKKLDEIKSDEYFNGKAQSSKLIGLDNNLKQGANERYNTSFADGSYSFFNQYFNNIKKSFFDFIPIEDIDNESYGYQYPSNEDIEYYLDNISNNPTEREAEKKKIFNTSSESIDAWIMNSFGIQSNKLFILGKVGSGKSTFLQLLKKKFTLKEKEYKSIFIDIAYQKESELSDFIKNIKLKNFEEKKDKILHHLKCKLKLKILKKIFTSNIISSESFITQNELNNVLSILDNNKINFGNIKNFIKYDNNIIDNDIDILFNFYLNALHKKSYKVIISIDGFDILNPKLKQKYNHFFKLLLANIQNTGLSDNYELNKIIYYITTFRSCTASKLGICCSNDQIFKLAPPSEEKLIIRAIEQIVQSNGRDFYKNNKNFFIDFLKVILNTIKKHIVLNEYKNHIIAQFDFDYRLLFEYIFQIQCYVISKLLTAEKYNFFRNYDVEDAENNIQKNLQLNINDKKQQDVIIENIKEFLNQKKYIIVDILLLKNSNIYENPYTFENLEFSLKQEVSLERENHNLNLFNNIYNYLFETKEGVFPLLIKYRILQFLLFASKVEENPYKYNSSDINEKLRKLGYILDEQLKYIIEELIISKFIRIRINNNETKYAINNKGKLILELAKKSAYYQHIISVSKVPKNKFANAIVPYTPNKTETKKALINGIKVSLAFLLLLKFIEKEERENIKNINERTYNDIFIYETMRENTIKDIEHIMKGFKKLYQDENNFNNINFTENEYNEYYMENNCFSKDIKEIEDWFNEKLYQ